MRNLKEPLDEIVQLRAALEECAIELHEWVEHHYALTKDKGMMRQYKRDMEPVERARRLLDSTGDRCAT